VQKARRRFAVLAFCSLRRRENAGAAVAETIASAALARSERLFESGKATCPQGVQAARQFGGVMVDSPTLRFSGFRIYQHAMFCWSKINCRTQMFRHIEVRAFNLNLKI
jgi:hypothetical protein